ncbi:MAG: hypothetical protein KF861_12000 [Planctomycetaceae bacterium]|nr:hypothetical protein [Planctomycetaceae bacterium]
MPRRQVTCGFFRIQHLVVLGLSVLATLMLSQDAAAPPPWSITITRGITVAIALVAYAGSIVWTLDRRGLGRVSIFAILSLSAAAVAGAQTLTSVASGAAATSLVIAAEFASAWLLGTAVTGMLLGHWYLTATSMPLAPLVRLNQFFFSAGILRAIVAGMGLATCPVAITDATHVIWLVLRWLSGIAGPVVMATLIGRILIYRNTQSATGVFFAGVILVFLGEMAATLLSNELGHPL